MGVPSHVSSAAPGGGGGKEAGPALTVQSPVFLFPPQTELCCRAPRTRWSFENFPPGLRAPRARAVELVPGDGVRVRGRGRAPAGCASSRCA